MEKKEDRDKKTLDDLVNEGVSDEIQDSGEKGGENNIDRKTKIVKFSHPDNHHSGQN